MDKLYLIIPAYNEEENVRDVIKTWYPIVERHSGGGESRLVVIDDGSKDHTYQIIKNCTKDRPYLIGITKKNEGHGATILHGYQYAIENGADYIFQTDSDGQTLPEEFEEFWNLREQYDMVIGERTKREDGISRVVVTKTLKAVIRGCFHVDVADANTPFRLMKAGVLKDTMPLIPPSFNLSNVLVSVIYAKKKRKIKYLPITFRARQGGTNSINLRKICKIGRQAVKDFKKINQALQE